MKHVHVKNLKLLSACNVGVNCARPTLFSECGVVSHENPFYEDGSQIAGDAAKFTKPGGSIWQLFRNDDSQLDNLIIRLPGPKPDGSNPLTLPILADLDGDGTPSCGPGCTPDYGDVEVACGFPVPFPTCDPSRAVTAPAGGDCTFDSLPGNGQCDLSPGTYGAVTLSDNAVLSLSSGNYTFCSFKGGRNVSIFGTGTTIHVPAGGPFEVNNTSLVGKNCGDLRLLVQGTGKVTFGRHSDITARVCAPASFVRLGHGNKLQGQFVGDFVDADDDNFGQCCGRCACFDSFQPTHAGPGDTVTLESGCDLNNVTALRICDLPASITSNDGSKLTAVVPAGAAGNCAVAVVSAVGSFVHVQKLAVP